MTDTAWLTELVRDIPDFPEPGIMFRDITPLLGDVDAFRFVVDALADEFAGETIDRVLGIEARGFLLAAPIAYRLGAALVPVRKTGKLPHDTHRESYQLEYGDDALELHTDALGHGEACLVDRRRAGHRRDGLGHRPPGRAPRAAGSPATASSSSSTPSRGGAGSAMTTSAPWSDY